jgi:hypothetical protein
LLPLQILWLELFIDVSTSVAFEREPEEPGIMQRPPRDREKPLLTWPLLGKITPPARSASSRRSPSCRGIRAGSSTPVGWRSRRSSSLRRSGPMRTGA